MDSFFERGTLHIGTVEGFRKAAGAMVGDRLDGSAVVSGEFDNWGPQTNADNPVLGRSMVFNGQFTGHLVIKDVKIKSPNMYAWCAADSYDSSTHERWRDEEEYDACFRIAFSRAFFREVSRAIAASADFLGHTRMTYYDSDAGVILGSPSAKFPAELLKGGKHYGDQREVRGFWKPKPNEPIVGFDIDVPTARFYCRPWRILEPKTNIGPVPAGPTPLEPLA